MTVRSVLLIILLSLTFMNVNFSCTVNSDPPDCVEDLGIPYRQQECWNYCGVACIQMWAHYDGWTTLTQNEIANEIGVIPGGNFAENAILGHDVFVMMGGTYYGGPAYYNPKNLDLTQQTF